MDLNIKETVEGLLWRYPALRDNDEKLITRVWELEDPLLVYGSYNDFKDAFESRKLPHPESIRRCRAALQQKYPLLRGNSYGARYSEQAKIKKQLKQIQNGLQ